MRGVVASETRAAQTGVAEWPAGLCGAGVGRPIWGRGSSPGRDAVRLGERHWKGRPQGVRVP